MNFACRMCRIAIAAEEGCAVCNPLRAMLVVVGEDEAERPSLAGTAAETVSVLRGILKTTRETLKVNPSSSTAKKDALALANSMAKVLESARKLQADGVAAVANMSFQEKKELFVTWYAELAPAYRNSVREAFADFEAMLAKPVATEESLVS